MVRETKLGIAGLGIGGIGAGIYEAPNFWGFAHQNTNAFHEFGIELGIIGSVLLLSSIALREYNQMPFWENRPGLLISYDPGQARRRSAMLKRSVRKP